jgi:hypothetical protein
MSNGFVPTSAAAVQGPDIRPLLGGQAQQRAQEQQQKGMLSQLVGVDMTGMSEQGIKYASSLRNNMIQYLDENEGVEFADFIKDINLLNDFIVQDKNNYAKNLAAAKPILDAARNDASYYDFRTALEKAGKYMSQEEVLEYFASFDQTLENPYGQGNYFEPTTGMVYPNDPGVNDRNMQPRPQGVHILGYDAANESSFQYKLHDIPTGDVMAYMQSGPEANLLSKLGAVDNSIDAKQKIRNHFETYILGSGAGRKSLQESMAGQLGYEIPDLAGKIADLAVTTEDGIQGALQERGVQYASSFSDNAEVIYKNFEEYYMDMFNANQRQKALDNKDDVKAPKYNFSDVTIGSLSSPPDVNLISSSLEGSTLESDIESSIESLSVTGIPEAAQAAEEKIKIYESIKENGFLEIRNTDPIEIQPMAGSDEPIYKVNSFSATKGSTGIYLIMNGYQNESDTYTTYINPGEGVISQREVVVDGIPETEYTIAMDPVKKNKMKPYRINSREADSFFSSLGNSYLRNVDLSTVNFGDSDREEFNQRLGFAIFVKKLSERNSVDSEGNLIYPPGSMEQSLATDIINRARLNIN